MRTTRFISLFFALSLLFGNFLFGQNNTVSLTEETITIPTYLVDKPDVNPWFYVPIDYQNAQFHIYPYLYVNKLTDKLEDVEYKAIVLENEYTKIVVLPEFGGRVYQALDKTNGYNFYYYNRVIKPTLIGMNGAWLSGGIEWNIPHHHHPGSYMPADYKLVENPDGSKTIWVGQFEKRQRMRWVVALTLHPGTSYLEITPKLFNTNPIEQPSLMWVNTSVHSNLDYQCVFPEDANLATYHTKNKFTDWPISYGYYDGNNFAKGYDISWWKNTLSPTSFFCYHSDYDFMAGIDNGKKTGTVQVGDHHVVPGKKMWNWGNNDIGRMWDDLLTDADGPYVELMMGTYSDNQPDYVLNAPGQSRISTMYFYPMKDMDYIKNANKDFAINMAEMNDKLLIQANATSEKNVTVEIISTQDEKIIFSQSVTISPIKTYSKEINMPEGELYSLTMRIVPKESGETLLYTPEKVGLAEHPKPYKDPADPADIKTVEQLVLAGIRLFQFSNPYLRGEAYFEEALKRDENNAAANTQMGIYYLKKYDYLKAESFLRKAVDRVTYNFTKPRFADPLYYLGLSLYYQDKNKEAYDLLNQAAWRNGWTAPSLYIIARMDCKAGNFDKALGHINSAIDANATNIDAVNLKTMILRTLGQYEKAWDNTKIAEKLNPLSFNNMYEQALLSEHLQSEKSKADYLAVFKDKMRGDADNYLEIASRYGESGFYNEAIAMLEMAAGSDDTFEIATTPFKMELKNNPMIYYYLGYYSNLSGNSKKAKSYFKKASSKSVDYCFPYGESSLAALQDAVNTIPEDAHGHYLLGNLLCDFQPEKAETEWESAIKYQPDFPIAYRNLSWVQGQILNKMDDAITNINKAIEQNPNDAEYYADADEYLRFISAPVQKREDLFKNNVNVLRQSDKAFTTYLAIENLKGNYQLVIDEMSKRHFRVLENVERIHHQHWAVAHIMLGRKNMEEQKYDSAIYHFNEALRFPKNLELRRDGKEKEAYYYLGQVYRILGEKEKSETNLKKLLEIESVDAYNSWGAQDWLEITYYKILAAKQMNCNDLAEQIQVSLWEKSKAYLNKTYPAAYDWKSVRRRFEKKQDKAQGYFALGLFYYASSEFTRAEENFRKTLEILPGYFSAQDFLNMTLKKKQSKQ